MKLGKETECFTNKKERVKRMKMWLRLVCVFLCVLLVGGCAAPSPGGESSPEDAVQIHANGDGSYTITINGERYSQLELLNQPEDCGRYGNVVGAWVYGKTENETEYTPILLVQTEDGLMAERLDPCATYYPLIYVADVDGDQEDEVIVNNVRTAMGIGQYRLHVFSTASSVLTSIYDFPKTVYTYSGSDADIPYDELNFGFQGYVRDGFQLYIENPSLHYEETVLLEGTTIDSSLWDEDGQALASEENVIRFNTFHDVEVMDIDGDGVFEIVGKQHVAYGTKRSIGVMSVTLQYKAGAFEVVQAVFELQEKPR